MERTQTVKLTNSQISESFCKVINRLMEGHSVDLELIRQIPEIQLADQCKENAGVDTMKLDQDVRKPMQNGILRKINSLGSYTGIIENEEGQKVPSYDGYVERGRQVHFVLGLPASGKSSALADVCSQEFNARLIDSDMIKEAIPEFNGGWGATTVHNESKKIMQQSFEDALALGDNIVVPRIGEPPESIMEMMRTAKDAGYSVNIHYMDLDANKALGRMLGRFVYSGRYMEPEIMCRYIGQDGENLMHSAFETLRDCEYCDGYSEWSNDVEFGKEPVLVDCKGISGRFLDDARRDVENLIGVEPEDEFIKASAQYDINNSVVSDAILAAKHKRNEAETSVRVLTTVEKQGREYHDKMMQSYQKMMSTTGGPTEMMTVSNMHPVKLPNVNLGYDLDTKSSDAMSRTNPSLNEYIDTSIHTESKDVEVAAQSDKSDVADKLMDQTAKARYNSLGYEKMKKQVEKADKDSDKEVEQTVPTLPGDVFQ